MTSRIITSLEEYALRNNPPGYIAHIRERVQRRVFEEALRQKVDLSRPFLIQTAILKGNPNWGTSTERVEARLVTEVYPKWQCHALYNFPDYSHASSVDYRPGAFSVVESDVTFVEERCRLLREHDGSHQFHVNDSLVNIPDRQIGHRA